MSDDIVTVIKPEEINSSITKPDGTLFHYFDAEQALALLLLNEVVFLGSLWYAEHSPEHIQEATSVSVLCSDLFAWGCADAEGLPFKELEPFYKMWKADPRWGVSKWCILRRQMRPQPPIIKRMQDAGVWDEAMQALPKREDEP